MAAPLLARAAGRLAFGQPLITAVRGRQAVALYALNF
jgi:hypothetical protein